MSYVAPKNYEEMLSYIKCIIDLVNSNQLSVVDGASHIVGASIANNNFEIEDFYKEHVHLLELVETCADLEIHDTDLLLNSNDLPDDTRHYWNKVVEYYSLVSSQSKSGK